MSSRTLRAYRLWPCLLLVSGWVDLAHAQPGSAAVPASLGTPPPAAAMPRLEFAFEFRVTLSPAVVVGDTAFGHRQYIPITGGRIAGPKLTGEVLPGGWDYQLGLVDGCSMLSADYFIRAREGTVIHVLNEGMFCGAGHAGAERSYFRPRFEAPKGTYEWLTHSTFIAALEVERAPGQASGPGLLEAVRLKFYQVR